jgi:hypothetical protein
MSGRGVFCIVAVIIIGGSAAHSNGSNHSHHTAPAPVTQTAPKVHNSGICTEAQRKTTRDENSGASFTTLSQDVAVTDAYCP